MSPMIKLMEDIMSNPIDSMEGFRGKVKNSCVSWVFDSNSSSGALDADYCDENIKSAAEDNLCDNVKIGGSYFDNYLGKALPVNACIFGILPSKDMVNDVESAITYTSVTMQITFDFYLRGRVVSGQETLTKTISLIDGEHETGQIMSSFTASISDILNPYSDDITNILVSFSKLNYDEIRVYSMITGSGTPERDEETNYTGLSWCNVSFSPIPNFG